MPAGVFKIMVDAHHIRYPSAKFCPFEVVIGEGAATVLGQVMAYLSRGQSGQSGLIPCFSRMSADLSRRGLVSLGTTFSSHVYARIIGLPSENRASSA